MYDLTETQRTVLTAAAERPRRHILPLPDRIKGGAAKKVLTALAARGLIRDNGDGASLVVTDDGLRAIGLEPTPTEPCTDATTRASMVRRRSGLERSRRR